LIRRQRFGGPERLRRYSAIVIPGGTRLDLLVMRGADVFREVVSPL
jgi:hypothetical protein